MVIHDALHNDPRHWWYNWKTGEVEHGPKSIGSDRYGPYFSEAEAHRALAIIRQRSSEWEAEEAGQEEQR